MRSGHRRTATRVRDGRVQKKNNWELDRGDYLLRTQDEIRLDRRPPGPGYRQLLTIADVRAFIALLPVWDEVAVAARRDRARPRVVGLHGVVRARGRGGLRVGARAVVGRLLAGVGTPVPPRA